ncbi:uncharacterized protein DUF3862 [Mesorhizobium sp. J18]|uniref:DUF3862 domain-containing protein n=1 Tax=Mesorhizobium sp. J18 TaxID=935263 RepID=UPI001199C177|nr:DUF3862 domain-containing protein [Mesorhizobium sp. J18]TWG90352.1 uncharacterized protein DUF3862 [Mesorhizobium sp. J18]
MRTVFAALAIVVASSSAMACEVTMAQYSELQTGMSYAEAVQILGCDGEEMSSSEIAGIKTVMLMWEGESLGANMNAMFQNDKLVSKAQFGLK